MTSKVLQMQFGILSEGRWTGEWSKPRGENVAPTLHQLRSPSRYWVISDVQLKRDLRGRTLDDIYRENRAKRGVEGRYQPRTVNDQSMAFCGGRQLPGHVSNENRRKACPLPLTLAEEYAEWCKARGHTPHPASVDPAHPLNKHREKCPPREKCDGHIVSRMDENEDRQAA